MIDCASGKPMTADQIRASLAHLQFRYERNMAASAFVPPSIHRSSLAGITKQMDKLDAALKKLEQAAA